jgi:hypothetical protein
MHALIFLKALISCLKSSQIEIFAPFRIRLRQVFKLTKTLLYGLKI